MVGAVSAAAACHSPCILTSPLSFHPFRFAAPVAPRLHRHGAATAAGEVEMGIQQDLRRGAPSAAATEATMPATAATDRVVATRQ